MCGIGISKNKIVLQNQSIELANLFVRQTKRSLVLQMIRRSLILNDLERCQSHCLLSPSVGESNVVFEDLRNELVDLVVGLKDRNLPFHLIHRCLLLRLIQLPLYLLQIPILLLQLFPQPLHFLLRLIQLHL